MSEQIAIQHRHKTLILSLSSAGAFELHMDGCLRKQRLPGREPQYVWTNVELEWEEHHYIEARYWASTDRFEVTVNGAPLAAGIWTDQAVSVT